MKQRIIAWLLFGASLLIYLYIDAARAAQAARAALGL